MYKIDRRGGGSKNRSLGQTQEMIILGYILSAILNKFLNFKTFFRFITNTWWRVWILLLNTVYSTSETVLLQTFRSQTTGSGKTEFIFKCFRV